MNIKYLVLTILIIGFIACNQSTPTTTENNSTEVTSESISEEQTITTTQKPLVESYQNQNGVPIYNGFIDADTTKVAAGNKYIIDVVAYELWGKFLYLNKNYEVVATNEPESIATSDLGVYHPYLVRVTMMPKPYSIQNAQEVEIRFSEMGIPSIHRTDFLKARLDGWDQQLSTTKNFAACTENDLRCNAERVLETVVGSMFR